MIVFYHNYFEIKSIVTPHALNYNSSERLFQVFNPHASLCFCFVLFYFNFFSRSLFFAPSSDYLNGWNGLFGYDSVDISQRKAVYQEKVRRVPTDEGALCLAGSLQSPSNITRHVYRLQICLFLQKKKFIRPLKLSHSSSFL